MTVNTLELLFMIGVVILAMFNYIIHNKLSDYLYMSAGVTSYRALEYLADHNGSKHQLYKWLASVAVNSKQFKKMKILCFAPAYHAAFSVFIIMLTLQTEQIIICEVYFFISLVLTLIISNLGFSCGNKVKLEFDNGMVYDPENAEIEDDIEYVKRPNLFSMFFKNMIYNAMPVLVVCLIFIAFAVFSMISNSHNEQPDLSPETTANDFYKETEQRIVIDESMVNAVINPDVFFNKLANEGLYCDDIFSVALQYPQYTFENCVRANGNAMSFTSYVLDNENDANEFCNLIVSSLIESGMDFNTENHKIDNHSVTAYSNESEYGYTAIIYSENSILYIECDNYKIEWLNDFLG